MKKLLLILSFLFPAFIQANYLPYGSSIQVVWNGNNGNGILCLDNSAGDCGNYCPSVTCAEIPVITPISAINGPAIVCAGSQTKYNVPDMTGSVYNLRSTTEHKASCQEQAIDLSVTNGCMDFCDTVPITIPGSTWAGIAINYAKWEWFVDGQSYSAGVNSPVADLVLGTMNPGVYVASLRTSAGSLIVKKLVIIKSFTR